MSDHKYASHMKQIQRERETEAEVRSLDADDIVRWIHRLEDEIREHEESPAQSLAAVRAEALRRAADRFSLRKTRGGDRYITPAQLLDEADRIEREAKEES